MPAPNQAPALDLNKVSRRRIVALTALSGEVKVVDLQADVRISSNYV